MRKELKYLLIVCFFLFAFVFNLEAESIPVPRQTELSRQEGPVERINYTEVTKNYRSQLSAEEIISFYRRHLSSLGFQELRDPLIPAGFFAFEKTLMHLHPLRSVMIRIQPGQEGYKTFYSLTEHERTLQPILPFPSFAQPQELDFAPVFGQSRQFVYNTYWHPMIGVGYLSEQDPSVISEFYLKNMPSFGWELAGQESHQGRYSIYEWLLVVDPFTKVIPNMEVASYDEVVPPLQVRGRTLNFRRGGESCTITVYNFPDIVERARGTFWDAGPIQKYGNTLICVYYFSN